MTALLGRTALAVRGYDNARAVLGGHLSAILQFGTNTGTAPGVLRSIFSTLGHTDGKWFWGMSDGDPALHLERAKWTAAKLRPVPERVRAMVGELVPLLRGKRMAEAQTLVTNFIMRHLVPDFALTPAMIADVSGRRSLAGGAAHHCVLARVWSRLAAVAAHCPTR